MLLDTEVSRRKDEWVHQWAAFVHSEEKVAMPKPDRLQRMATRDLLHALHNAMFAGAGVMFASCSREGGATMVISMDECSTNLAAICFHGICQASFLLLL